MRGVGVVAGNMIVVSSAYEGGGAGNIIGGSSVLEMSYCMFGMQCI